MLQIKLKVSTFFAPSPSLLLSHIRLRLEPRLGSDWDLDSDADAGLDSDSDSVEVWLRLHLHAQHFQMTITNLFAAHFTSQQHFCQFSLCWKLLFNFFVNCWSCPPPLSLSVSGSSVIAVKFVKNGRHCCLFTARKLVSAVDPLTY